MILDEVFIPKAINISLLSEEKDEVLEELVEQFVSVHPEADRFQILDSIMKRESKMSTGIMPNIAVPHGRTSIIKGVHGVIGISRRGIDYDSLDNAPVYLFFLLISSSDDSELHLCVLKRLAQLLSDSTFYKKLMEQQTPEGVHKVLRSYEDSLASD